MSKIDEFESLFKSAAKPVFHVEPIKINKALIVVDIELELVSEYVDRVQSFLKVLNSVNHTVEVQAIGGDQFSSVQQLLDRVAGEGGELVCTYRNLHGSADEYPFSLGEHVDVLTQASRIPILLTPRPEAFTENTLNDSDRVMLMTDHLAGDNRIVTYGAMFTQDHGELTLAHVEDEQTFERYIQVISKIPDIDTDVAREQILEQLLKEPRDFVASCEQGLQEAGLPISVNSIVTVGHHLNDYKKLVTDNQTDLLIMNTKDEDQLAMHGLAYPVSVELREVPLLMI